MEHNNLSDFEEVTNQPYTDSEVLSAFIPAALRDGALLIELIETKDSPIKNALILTLHEEQCPANDKPDDATPAEGIWCWNMRRACWHNLKFADIDAASPFPPIQDDEL
jgi:hypothetical protein